MDRVPCSYNPECRYFEAGCFEDVHHLAWPKRIYQRPIEREYRELPQNKVRMCRQEHDELHATEIPPPKPAHHIMKSLVEINGLRRVG